MTAALYFEPDAYAPEAGRIMGRHAASRGFLRAVAEAATSGPVTGFGPSRGAVEFAALVAAANPAAGVSWIAAERQAELSAVGALHIPGPVLGRFAQSRLRVGPAAWSLTGVVHTTASHAAMDAVAGLLSAPVMPWDALISTSRAVSGTLAVVLEAEQDYLRWRFAGEPMMTLPVLPVIPLGVHCDDFHADSNTRAAARAEMGISPDEVAVLYVGRLSQHAKAHPYPMYLALQAVAVRTGARLALVQCGWFANAAVEESFKSGAELACPGVRHLFPSGVEDSSLARAWAAADIFISLADNIQETFGLTPVEAMAAGLPVVVSDWDGYRDTVRDGIDGFRIPSWAPPPGLGEVLAEAYEAGNLGYDLYCGLACQTVSLDMAALAGRLSELVANPELRRRMGAAGQARARAEFDWSRVLAQYQTLWTALAEMRTTLGGDWAERLARAPRAAAARQDPYRSFGHYPTAAIRTSTLVLRGAEAEPSRYGALTAHPMFSYARTIMPAPELVSLLLARLGPGMSVAELAAAAGMELAPCLMNVAVLAKLGFVELRAPG